MNSFDYIRPATIADAIAANPHDPHVNAPGIKGVGEIGVTGTAGAVANAVWHATGIAFVSSRLPSID